MGNRLRDIPGYRRNSGCYMFDYQQPFTEATDRRSRARYNPDTKVCDIYYNIKTPMPLNRSKTAKYVQKSLKYFLGADKFICTVSESQAACEGTYCTNIQFYYRDTKAPDPQKLEQVPSIISDNVVPIEFQRTDVVTGESCVVSFDEIEPKFRYGVMKICRGSQINKKSGKRKSVDGAYWTFC